MIILFFSIPIIVFLVLDIVSEVLWSFFQIEEEEEIFIKITKVFFLISSLSLPLAFIEIANTLEVTISGPWVIIGSGLILVFFTLFMFAFIQKIVIGKLQQFVTEHNNIIDGTSALLTIFASTMAVISFALSLGLTEYIQSNITTIIVIIVSVSIAMTIYIGLSKKSNVDTKIKELKRI